MHKVILSLPMLLLVAACTAQPTITKEDQLATVVAGTLTAMPSPAAQPIAATTTVSPPTTAPSSGPFYTITSAQNVNLRTLPGTLFPVSRVMAQGTSLQVLGVSPGDGWLYVVNPEGISGWVDVNFLHNVPLGIVQTVEPQGAQVLRGRLIDKNNNPVDGVGFAIIQANRRTDAVTDADGNFYAYLPLSASGVWTVSYVSLAGTSSAMNNNCMDNHVCGATQPASVNVTLPVADVINFGWTQP